MGIYVTDETPKGQKAVLSWQKVACRLTVIRCALEESLFLFLFTILSGL